MAVGAAVVVGGAFIWSADSTPKPPDEYLVHAFRDHGDQFRSLRCGSKAPTAPPRQLAKLGAQWVYCDDHGTIRVLFGASRFATAIGPGWSKGMTYLPAGPQRAGDVVPSTDEVSRLPPDVYLRPIQGSWFVYYQRDD